MEQYTYNNLCGKTMVELNEIKKAMQDRLYELHKKKCVAIGNILSIQDTLHFEETLVAKKEKGVAILKGDIDEER